MRNITRFEVGEAVGSTLRTWAKLFVPLTALGLVAAVPVVLLALLFPLDTSNDGAGLPVRMSVMTIAVSLIGAIFSLAASGAASDMVFRHLHGEPVIVGRSLSQALSKLGSLIVLAILIALAFLPFGLVAAGVAFFLPILGILLAFAIGIAAIIMFLGFTVAAPALVVENLPAVEAMKRSWTLTKGRRGAIFGALFITGLLVVVFVGVLAFFLEVDVRKVHDIAEIVSKTRRNIIVNTLAGAPFNMLVAVLYAVIYHDLRIEKEGVRSEDLTKVFG